MHEILNLNLNVIIVNKKKKVLLVLKVHILGRYERHSQYTVQIVIVKALTLGVFVETLK